MESGTGPSGGTRRARSAFAAFLLRTSRGLRGFCSSLTSWTPLPLLRSRHGFRTYTELRTLQSLSWPTSATLPRKNGPFHEKKPKRGPKRKSSRSISSRRARAPMLTNHSSPLLPLSRRFLFRRLSRSSKRKQTADVNEHNQTSNPSAFIPQVGPCVTSFCVSTNKPCPTLPRSSSPSTQGDSRQRSVPQQAPPTIADAYAVASMHSYPAMYAEVVEDVRAGHFEPNYE